MGISFPGSGVGDASLQRVFITDTRSSSLTNDLGRERRTQAHMATRKFILTVLVLYSTTSSVLTQNDTTYVRELPSGRKVLCERCPPGSHLQKHCTETQRTVCRPCSGGFYTEYWNYLYDCLPCDWCSSDHVVTRECTKSSNRVCQCKEGFYWDNFFCQPHTVCPAGSGVKEKGTSDRDTVCEPCKNGHYASQNTQCLPHTECKAEEKLLFRGTIHMDNVCATFDQIKQHGWVKLIELPFIEIFKNHNSRRLRRFIRHLCLKDYVMDYVTDHVPDHDGWIQQLRWWFSEATEQQVFSLPKLLRETGMKNLANKIEQRLKRIQDEVSLCENTVLSGTFN